MKATVTCIDCRFSFFSSSPSSVCPACGSKMVLNADGKWVRYSVPPYIKYRAKYLSDKVK